MSGVVLGSIRGKRVLLRASSHFEGDVFHGSLLIEEGASFRPRGTMQLTLGFDLRRAPLVERKRVLAELLSGVGLHLIRFCEHIEGDVTSPSSSITTVEPLISPNTSPSINSLFVVSTIPVILKSDVITVAVTRSSCADIG